MKPAGWGLADYVLGHLNKNEQKNNGFITDGLLDLGSMILKLRK